jgi:Domain of unknown function (DUF222)
MVRTYVWAHAADGLLTPLARATVGTALWRIEQELFDAEWAQARAEHGDQTCAAHISRTPAQRRHDALVEMARRAMVAPADGRRPEPLVSVMIGYETFKGRVCQLADGTVITPGTVASLLARRSASTARQSFLLRNSGSTAGDANGRQGP